MSVSLGHKAYIGIGVEGVWGTQVASSQFLEVNSEGLVINEPRGQSGSIYRINTEFNRVFKGGITAQGDIAFDARYDGWEQILKQAMGSCVDSGSLATTGFLHTFTISDSLPTGLTLEKHNDQVTQKMIGCKIQSIGFNQSTDGLLNLSVSVVGKDLVSGAKGTETFTTTELIKYSDCAITWGGTTQNIIDFNLRLSNNLDAGRRFIGSRYISEPVRGGKIAVEGSFTLELEDLSKWNDFRDAAAKALVFTWTSANVIPGSAAKFCLAITIPCALLTDASASASGEGRITYSCPFKGFMSGANKELSIVLTNGVASVA